jgi:hypothetical protein
VIWKVLWYTWIWWGGHRKFSSGLLIEKSEHWRIITWHFPCSRRLRGRVVQHQNTTWNQSGQTMQTIKGHQEENEQTRGHHSKFMLITSFFLYLLLHRVTLLLWIERFNQRLISFLFFLPGLAFLFIAHHIPYKIFILVYICFMVDGSPNPSLLEKHNLNFKDM